MGGIPTRAVLVSWLFLLSAIAFLDRTNLTVAGMQISREYRLDNVRLGWLLSAFLVGYATSQVLAGWLAVRLGPRRALTLGVLWWGVFTLATAAVPPTARGALWILIAIRLALGIGEAIIYPTSNQFVARWIPVSERGRVNGVIFAGVGAGSMLTPPILTVIIVAVWLASWVLVQRGGRDNCRSGLVRDCARHSRRASLGVARRARHHSCGDPRGRFSEAADSLGRHCSQPVDDPADICLLLLRIHRVDLPWVVFPLYGAGASHELESQCALLDDSVCCDDHVLSHRRRAVRLACKTLWAAHRPGRSSLCRPPLCGGLLIAGSHAASATLAALTLAAGVGGLYISQSSYWSVTADIAGRNAGVVSSIMNTGAQIGGAVTTTLTPWLAERFGWWAGFLAAALLAFAGAFAWLGVNPEIQLSALPESSDSAADRVHQAG